MQLRGRTTPIPAFQYVSPSDGYPDDLCHDAAACIDKLRDANLTLIDRTEAAERRLAEAMSALKPFAAFVTPDPKFLDDNHPITQGSSMAKRQVTVGDFRCARARCEKDAKG